MRKYYDPKSNKSFFLSFAGGPLNGLVGRATLTLDAKSAKITIKKFDHLTNIFLDYLSEPFKIVVLHKTKRWDKLHQYTASMVCMEFFQALDSWYMLAVQDQKSRVKRAIYVGDESMQVDLAATSFCSVPLM